jgi:hypothetical protein
VTYEIPAELQARHGVGSRHLPSDVDESLFRISVVNQKRILRATLLVYLGKNGLGDDVYDLVGTPWCLYLRSFQRPSRSGKLGQVHVAPRPTHNKTKKKPA